MSWCRDRLVCHVMVMRQASLSCHGAGTGESVMSWCRDRLVRHVMVQREASLSCHSSETG